MPKQVSQALEVCENTIFNLFLFTQAQNHTSLSVMKALVRKVCSYLVSMSKENVLL